MSWGRRRAVKTIRLFFMCFFLCFGMGIYLSDAGANVSLLGDRDISRGHDVEDTVFHIVLPVSAGLLRFLLKRGNTQALRQVLLGRSTGARVLWEAGFLEEHGLGVTDLPLQSKVGGIGVVHFRLSIACQALAGLPVSQQSKTSLEELGLRAINNYGGPTVLALDEVNLGLDVVIKANGDSLGIPADVESTQQRSHVFALRWDLFSVDQEVFDIPM